MISVLEKEIALRYLKTRKKDGFINIISIFSFIGISLGVAVLIIVMSVMNGFRSELVNKIIGFNPHITVKPYSNSIDYEKLKDNNLLAISDEMIFTNTGETVVINKDYTKGLVLRGYAKNDFPKLEVIKKSNFIGKKNLTENYISIGKELSFDLNLEIGDKLLLMSSSGVQTIIGSLPKQQLFVVNSIFDSGLADFDQNIAFININALESFFDLKEKDRILEIYLKEPIKIEMMKNKVQNIFKNEFVYSWADMNNALFSALKVERNVMFIILSLIIMVAAFNIISGLTILVTNKTRDIAILKSIGVTNYSIKKIFFFVGLLIGTFATFFGIILGIFVSVNIEKLREFLSNAFNIKLFPEEIYFLSNLPSEISFESIAIIAFCSIIISTIVSIYPAVKASNLDTIKSLKYE